MSAQDQFLDKEAIALAPLKERVTGLENTTKFLEAKVQKLENILKSLPSNYIVPHNAKVALEKGICKRCQTIDAHYKGVIESKDKKLEKMKHLQEIDNQEARFLIKRVVAVYGNKALVDLMGHTDNPNFTEERREQYMKVKPHL